MPLLSAGRSEIDPYKADSKIPPHRVGADVLIGPQAPANSQIPGAVVGAGFMSSVTYAFAITVDEKAIGSIGVYRQENIHRQTAELGYYIAEEYWGKGIMTEAIKQICQHVFQKSDIIRIYAEPFAYNIASCRALEKAGFQYEGTLRNNAVKNGKVIDMKMYSILNTEL